MTHSDIIDELARLFNTDKLEAKEEIEQLEIFKKENIRLESELQKCQALHEAKKRLATFEAGTKK